MRLVGYVDGVEITFDFTPPDTFKAVIPKQLDGIYIVELHLIDDAGNQAFYSNIFVKIDLRHLKIQVLPDSFVYVENGQGIGYRGLNPNYTAVELRVRFSIREAPTYSFRELVIAP